MPAVQAIPKIVGNLHALFSPSPSTANPHMTLWRSDIAKINMPVPVDDMLVAQDTHTVASNLHAPFSPSPETVNPHLIAVTGMAFLAEDMPMAQGTAQVNELSGSMKLVDDPARPIDCEWRDANSTSQPTEPAPLPLSPPPTEPVPLPLPLGPLASELTPLATTPALLPLGPLPAESNPLPIQAAQPFAQSAPLPTELAPLPTEPAPLPIDLTPLPDPTTLPTELAPLPTDPAPLPSKPAPLPLETTPLLTHPSPLPTGPIVTEIAPLPADSAPLLAEPATLPVDISPVPTESASATTDHDPLPLPPGPLPFEAAPFQPSTSQPVAPIPPSTFMPGEADLPPPLPMPPTEPTPQPRESAPSPAALIWTDQESTVFMPQVAPTHEPANGTNLPAETEPPLVSVPLGPSTQSPSEAPSAAASSGLHTDALASLPPTADWAAARRLIDDIERASNVGELQALLQHEFVRSATDTEQTEAVRRTLQYVSGLKKKGEQLFGGWAVVSVNEWGIQQDRVLVVSSHSLYRVAFHSSRGSVSHYARTSLANIRRVERGVAAFKVISSEPDGRENPFAYIWSEYVSKGPRDKRYERVYYLVTAPSAPFELVQAVLLTTLKAASRILCAQVGSVLAVTPLEIVDHAPSVSVIDEVADKLVPSLQRLSDNISGVLKKVEGSLASRPGSAASTRSTM